MCGREKEMNETGRKSATGLKRGIERNVKKKRDVGKSDMGGNGQIDKREMARFFFLSRA